MKKSALLLPLFGFFAYVTLSSDSNGPGGNKTGSHGVAGGCYSCHGNSATPAITMAFELDSAGVPVTRYKPGMLYTLKMTATNTTTASLPKFGGQLSVVKGSGTTSTQAGSISSLPAGTSLISSAGISIVQHNQRLSPATGSGATGTTYAMSVSWTAPAYGTGTVTAYGVINAIDNDGNDNSTDKWNTGSASFTELPPPVGVNNVAAANLNIYPNPVSNILNIAGYTGRVTVYDMNGKIIAITTADNTTAINTSTWTSGMYMVVLGDNEATRMIVKK